jgi:hypothetical protein
MLTFRHPMFAGALLGLATLAAPASAVTTVYTAQSAFLAQLGGAPYTETFTGLADPLGASPQVFGSGPFVFAASTVAVVDGVMQGSGGHGLVLSALGGSLSVNQVNDALTITFVGAAVTAFGADFYAIDMNDKPQSVDLTLQLSDGTTVRFNPTAATGSYRGFTSTVDITGFTVVTSNSLVRNLGSSFYTTLDNLTVGTAAPVGSVPEPSRLALMGLGVAALWFMRRRAD